MNSGLIDFSLKNRNILVTGATGYLGRYLSKGLAQLGANVYINGRNQDKVCELMAEIQADGYSALPAIFDVTSVAQTIKWFNKSAPQVLHGIVNNAYSGNAGTIESSDDEDYCRSMNICLVVSARIFKLSLPLLRAAVKETGYSSVVNIGSMYGAVSPNINIYKSKEFANPPFYGAAKAALLQWTKYAACEFGAENIRINSVSPGPFPSDITRMDREFIDSLKQRVPMGRVGNPQEVIGPVAFLIGSASTFVNGADIKVDGGWTCW